MISVWTFVVVAVHGLVAWILLFGNGSLLVDNDITNADETIPYACMQLHQLVGLIQAWYRARSHSRSLGLVCPLSIMFRKIEDSTAAFGDLI